MNATHPAVKQADIIVTNILETGTAFAILVDTGEQVFMPSSIGRAVPLYAAELYKATLVPNAQFKGDPTKAPWMAVHVIRKDAPAPVPYTPGPRQAVAQIPLPAPEPEDAPLTEADVLLILADNALWSATAVPDEIYEGPTQAERQEVFDMLRRLHRLGKVGRVDLTRNEGQKRASYVFWTLDVDGFVAKHRGTEE